MRTEPAAIIAAITAIVAAVLVFLESFGVAMTDQQEDAVRGLVAVLAPLIAGLVIRFFVVSPQSAADAVIRAKTESPTEATVPQINVAGGGYAKAVEKEGYEAVPPAVNP